MKTPPLRAKLREATSSAILEAAEAVAAREGVAAASLQAIAEQAGTSVGTIYNYFGDKLELFDALFALRRKELFTAIDDVAKKHGKQPFAVQLDAFARAVFLHFDERRAFLRIALERETTRSPADKAKDGGKRPALHQLQVRAERVVQLGVREKQLRNDHAADLLATVLVSIVRGVLVKRAESNASFAAETERVLSLFLDGARK